MKALLGDLVNIKTGKLDANQSDENGKYPFFTCSKEISKINSYSYDCECVLIAGNGDLNVKYYNGKFEAYQRTYILTSTDVNTLSNKYLYWFMNRYIVQLRNQSIGGVIKYIKLGDLTNISLNLPTLDVQKRIVGIFESIERLIGTKVFILKGLDDLIKSRFVEMFGDPVINNKKWTSMNLQEISIKITSGNTPQGGSRVYINHGVLFIRSQNVWNNRLDLDDVVYISESLNEKMKETRLRRNDLLITKTGRFNTENSSLGRCALYTGPDFQANINGHVYLVRLKSEYNPNFILSILTSETYKNLIRTVCVGGIDKRQLNKSHIELFPIIIPPIELQNQYVQFLLKINKLKFA